MGRGHPTDSKSTPPRIVTREEWESALERLHAKEKELTRAHDALAAERRRLPWVRIEKDYVFQGRDGKAHLADLFAGRRQLLLYHFMFGPNQTAGCEGCSMFVDQVGHLAHLHARDTSFVLVSRAPIAVLEAYRKRLGWNIPWYSSFGTSFNPDFGRGPETPQPDEHQDGEMFGLSAFIRDGDAVCRTYFTSNRGVESLGPVWTLLDLTALGRRSGRTRRRGLPRPRPISGGAATTSTADDAKRPQNLEIYLAPTSDSLAAVAVGKSTPQRITPI